MRGRKKKENSLTEMIGVKLTKEQKDIIKKNPWIKKEIDIQVRNYINIYVT